MEHVWHFFLSKEALNIEIPLLSFLAIGYLAKNQLGYMAEKLKVAEKLQPAWEFAEGFGKAFLATSLLFAPAMYLFMGEIIRVTSIQPAPTFAPTAIPTLVPEIASRLVNIPNTIDIFAPLGFGILCLALPTAIILNIIYTTDERKKQ